MFRGSEYKILWRLWMAFGAAGLVFGWPDSHVPWAIGVCQMSILGLIQARDIERLKVIDHA